MSLLCSWFDHDWLAARDMTCADYLDIVLRCKGGAHPPRQVTSGPKANDTAKVCRRCGTWDAPLVGARPPQDMLGKDSVQP
jgi:hypothetical protein